MKPKNKLDKQVVDLSKKLKPLSKAEQSYVRNQLAQRGYMISRNRVFCTFCGHKDHAEAYKAKGDVICPVCKSKLSPVKTLFAQDRYFVTRTLMIGEFQVIQNFEITETHRKEQPLRIEWQHVNAFFILPNGKWTVISKLIDFYIDFYSGNVQYSSMLEPRNKQTSERYLMYYTAHVFDNGLHPILKRNGLDIDQYNASRLQRFNLLVLNLFNDNKVEHLLKVRQWALLNAYLGDNRDMDKYWDQVKICIRHQYEITDIEMWTDYLENLEYFNKDMRSPHYLCPDDLKAAHDRYMRKRRAAEQAKKLAEQIKNMARDNEAYVKRLGELLTLKFENKKVIVEPIKTVYDFQKLSVDMDICIFENKHYMKEDLLLLTATDKKTNELEVLSINLYNATIREMRGHSNKDSNLRSTVNNLIAKNRKAIKSLTI